MYSYQDRLRAVRLYVERWPRKSEHSDKWKLCDNNPGPRPEKAG